MMVSHIATVPGRQVPRRSELRHRAWQQAVGRFGARNG